MPYQLPIFKGWTVDARLREFRRTKVFKRTTVFHTWSFDTSKGKRLLNAYIKSLDSNTEECKRIIEAII